MSPRRPESEWPGLFAGWVASGLRLGDWIARDKVPISRSCAFDNFNRLFPREFAAHQGTIPNHKSRS